MKDKFNFIFKGTQKEMEEFIIKCDDYIDVPIAKWGDFNVVYNKLDAIFQVEEIKGYVDICPYFLPEKVGRPPFEQTLDDITLILNEMNAPNEFIDKLCELLEDCQLDTYEDIDEDKIDEINVIRNEFNFEIDKNKYKIYMNQKDILNFDNKANETNAYLQKTGIIFER